MKSSDLVRTDPEKPALISGLVVTLSGERALAAGALTALQAHPRIILGDVVSRWVPLAIECDDDAESRAIHDWISALPGVAYVDVVAVNFDLGEAA